MLYLNLKLNCIQSLYYQNTPPLFTEPGLVIYMIHKLWRNSRKRCVWENKAWSCLLTCKGLIPRKRIFFKSKTEVCHERKG